MCRIIGFNHAPIPFEVLGQLMDGLIFQSGGDGMGFSYFEGDDLCGVKCGKWERTHAPLAAELMLHLSKETDFPVLWHTRKTSSGYTNTEMSHPHSSLPTIDESNWEKVNTPLGEELMYIKGANGLFVHNGTLRWEELNMLKFSLAMSQHDVPMSYWNSLSDTMLMGEMFEFRQQDIATAEMLNFGVIVGMGKKEIKEKLQRRMYIVRSGTQSQERHIWAIVWNDGSWIVTSSVTSEFHDFLTKQDVKVFKIPSGTINNLDATVKLWADKYTPEVLANIKHKNEWIPARQVAYK